MSPDPEPVFLLKTGELYLKGDNRHLFLKKLVADLARVAARSGATVVDHVGKLAVRGAGHDLALLDALGRVFGIVSIEIATSVPTDEGAIVDQAVVLASERVREAAGALASFRIHARRSHKGFALSSVEVNRIAGAAVAVATGLSVNLDEPDLTIWIEVDSPRTYLYSRRVPAAGGLPAGSAGRAVLLLSGGIDSPVAGWLAMRRGLAISAVHFHSPPHTGPAALGKVEDLARALAAWQGRMDLFLVPFTAAQEAVRDAVREDYRVLAYRRLMMRVACVLAGRTRASAVVTGENLAQVASQTIENLGCVERACELTVLRPLVTYDKSEVIERARDLRTFDISIRTGEDCCSLFVPRHPVTRGRPGVCVSEEAKLDLDTLVRACVEGTVTETIVS